MNDRPGLLSAARRLVVGPDPRADGWLLLGLVAGPFWFALLAVLYLSGLASEFVLLAILFILGAHLLLRPIGQVERGLVRSLLGEAVPAPEPLRYARASGRWTAPLVSAARRSVAVLRDGHSWRMLVWTLVRVVTGPVGFLVVAARLLLPLPAVLAPLAVAADAVTARALDSGERVILPLCPLGLLLLPPLRQAAGTLARLHRRFAVWALGPDRHRVEAEALARAAAAEEQVRIDQELHDSLGHMLSMIVVQAGAGAHLFDRDPEFARRALGTIEQRGRAALGELDRIITDLRADLDSPGEADLPALVAGAREAGMDVTARLRIDPLPLPLGRAVYRIVQEALTNAAMHAPGSSVTVDVADAVVDTTERVVAVSVVDAARAPARPASARGAWVPPEAGSPGHGLASIRDRATLLGGAAAFGPTGEGGFAVRVVLPVAAALPGGTTIRCELRPGCDCLGCRVRRAAFG